MRQLLIFYVFVLLAFASCSPFGKINQSSRVLLADSSLQAAHVGISIYEPATGKWWYNYQGDKYFVPASNVKLATCYAAMKYLGDSLVGLRYGVPEESGVGKTELAIDFTGDPTFLHEDYQKHPVFDFLNGQLLKLKKRPGLLIKPKRFERWGDGWSWNDYEGDYMAERSEWPIYGNVVSVKLNDVSKRSYIDTFLTPGKRMLGKVFVTYPAYFDSVMNKEIRGGTGLTTALSPKLTIRRSISANEFVTENSDRPFTSAQIPFVTSWSNTVALLEDTLRTKRNWSIITKTNNENEYVWESDDNDIAKFHIKQWHVIHSQPTDSLLKPMMHRSDNFLAEQSLLMVSNERLGFMNDEKIIDTLLKTDFKDLPQKPSWADGSGLSRYNLFTPQDFVTILGKMETEFGMERLKTILPTGNEGTLKNYYKIDSAAIYAKTGTLSGVVALSGFLTTASGKNLIFSVLVNNHRASGTAVRRAVERFLQNLRKEH